MIKKLPAGILKFVQYGCVATVILQATVFLVLSSRGGFTKEKRSKIQAILGGVDAQKIRADELARYEPDGDASTMALSSNHVTSERQFGITDLESKLESLRVGLGRERQRYDLLRSDFSERLADRESVAIQRSREDLQKILESMDSKGAREQLIVMMRAGGINDVVNILDAMPESKKRKILAEFRQPGDEDRIHELLMRLRQQDQVNRATNQTGDDVGP